MKSSKTGRISWLPDDFLEFPSGFIPFRRARDFFARPNSAVKLPRVGICRILSAETAFLGSRYPWTAVCGMLTEAHIRQHLSCRSRENPAIASLDFEIAGLTLTVHAFGRTAALEQPIARPAVMCEIRDWPAFQIVRESNASTREHCLHRSQGVPRVPMLRRGITENGQVGQLPARSHGKIYANSPHPGRGRRRQWQGRPSTAKHCPRGHAQSFGRR